MNDKFESEAERLDYKAQARFVRAYYYWLLLRRYGPVPLLPDNGLDYDASYDELATPRAPYEEIADKKCLHYRIKRVSGNFRRACVSATPPEQPFRQDPAYVSEDNVTSCAMQAFIAGYCEISLIKSASERRNHFEPETDGYYNRKANTSSANTIGNDTGRTGWGIECYPAGTIELGERC